MRWFALILICTVLSTTCAEPEPKKYKPDIKEKDKEVDSSLTEEERQFLREVEAKFGVKQDVLNETKKSNEGTTDEQIEDKSQVSNVKPPFPAVIAIEIVNDTDTDTQSKGKRTIDANLGYGYKTNNGYSYTYLGKSGQEKGKFMIYPYSQEDIPPPNTNQYRSQNSQSSTNVEVQPSRAFELIEQQSYQQGKPSSESRTNYDTIKGLVSPPPAYSAPDPVQTSTPTTLYTTYNGQGFSDLSGKFPVVMPNYFVDSSQLLKNPQFQNAGLTQDHLRAHGAPVEQRVVPVLVLRIPSSYLKNPTAELYPNLPQNYPLSQYLNHVNLQEIVNNYFKKIGYSFAPQITTYQNSLVPESVPTPVSTPATNYEPQHYASPYVQPSYTQADTSGVQYSAVKPVMARYPQTYTRPHYYIPPSQFSYQQPAHSAYQQTANAAYQQHTQTTYQQVAQPIYQQPAQQYEYSYQFTPKSTIQPQTYYVQPQYQQAEQQIVSHEVQQENVAVNQEANAHNSVSQVAYGLPQQETVLETPVTPGVEYGTPEIAQPAAQYEATHSVSQEYGVPKEESIEYTAKHAGSPDIGPTKVTIPVYSAPQHTITQQYVSPQQVDQKDVVSVYQPSQSGHIPRHNFNLHAEAGVADAQSYIYKKQVTADNADNLVLTENYPSKDHTIATVLPFSYKHGKKSHTKGVQTVSYVTPMPFSSKFQSQYKVMVPQMIFKNAAPEKVTYVNSQSLSYNQNSSQEQNPEAEYTLPAHYVPPVGKQRPPYYPRNYHSHPKRMTKSEHRPENPSRKHVEGKKLV
ncbi:uncharacterized protein LOC113509320 [Galleria mellonella]|uniref:Uncharacterized protein LOC113509320 n=1 Tax=Galleria mellonella TaxID=7137 RepID=A0A6J3C7G3_GALME|nr:uncharacterized protein LOC113509320 [Galleria mellonella]